MDSWLNFKINHKGTMTPSISLLKKEYLVISFGTPWSENRGLEKIEHIVASDKHDTHTYIGAGTI